MTPTTFSAAWLMEQEFPPVRYVVPGVIPEGLTLLVAAPKIGKSWMMLDLAIAAASGGSTLGALHLTHSRPVLYLALEDGPRRLQDRLNALDVTTAPDRLYFAVSVARDELLGTIERFMRDHADDAPLVILDTLGKVMPAAQTGESDYQRDYRIGGELKAVADCVPAGSVIVVHHTRKASAEDFLDTVSGTQGLAGAADTILVLRRDRTQHTGSLSVTSRDAAEGEYQVTFTEGRWTLDGNDLREAASALAETRTTDKLGERSADVVSYVNAHPDGARAADVAEHLGITAKDAGTYLLRAFEAGRITRPSRGLYMPVGSVESVGAPDPLPTNPTLPTALSPVDQSADWDDPGYCTHGITIGGRCSKCGGIAREVVRDEQ